MSKFKRPPVCTMKQYQQPYFKAVNNSGERQIKTAATKLPVKK